MKKYFIATYGCQVNTRDSENIGGLLESLGLLEARNLEEADLIILNSCSVRQASEDKVYGFANKIKELRSKNKELRVILTGCLVGSTTGERPRLASKVLKKKTSWVDYYLNINDLSSLPEYLFRSKLIGEWGVKGNIKSWEPKTRSHSGTAYVNISQGCDNFCTFCVVPYARGKEISRPLEEILAEVRRCVKQGFREVMLLGQNVNSWGLDPNRKASSRKRIGGLPFSNLLKRVHEIEGLEKIKFLTSNPFDFTPDLVEALKLPKIDRYLHLPVQSGDNDILKKMNRRHTREDYLELVGEIKKTVPEMELGTDIIVGFPGETEEQFLKTVDLVKTVKFNVIYTAMYSPRPGTLSAKLYRDDIPRAEKRRRHAHLTKIWQGAKSSR